MSISPDPGFRYGGEGGGGGGGGAVLREGRHIGNELCKAVGIK